MRPKLKRVLIVDPHADVLINLQKLLEDAGFDTETAWSGGEAIELLHSELFNIVLVNEYLPDSTCDALLREIGTRWSDVVCVVMQPCATQMDDSDRFIKRGACAVVCKHDLVSVKSAVSQAVVPELSSWSEGKLRATG